MIRAFPIDCGLLAMVTILLFVFAWSGVSIAIADLMYCWMLSLAFTRSCITAYDLGKRDKENETIRAMTNAKNIGIHQTVQHDDNDKGFIHSTEKVRKKAGADIQEKKEVKVSKNVEVSIQPDWNPMKDFF